MAQQRPPHSDLHPMRVLFVIPKAEQPVLSGDQFSAHFKDFVAQCTAKDPQQRPSATALLAHPFLKVSHTAAATLPCLCIYLARVGFPESWNSVPSTACV